MSCSHRLLPPTSPGRMPLGDPQGFLRDAPRDASKTSPGMPLGKLERGSLWLTLPAGSCGSSGGAGSAAQGMDAGSLGRPVRSQPRQNQVAALPGCLLGACGSLCPALGAARSCQGLPSRSLMFLSQAGWQEKTLLERLSKYLVHHCHW